MAVFRRGQLLALSLTGVRFAWAGVWLADVQLGQAWPCVAMDICWLHGARLKAPELPWFASGSESWGVTLSTPLSLIQHGVSSELGLFHKTRYNTRQQENGEFSLFQAPLDTGGPSRKR